MALREGRFVLYDRDHNAGIVLLCVTLALATLWIKLALTPAWFDGSLMRNHSQLLAFQYTNNEQSRILQFLVPELLIRSCGVGVVTAYIIQRFCFTLLTLYLFYHFTQKWLTARGAVICLVLLALVSVMTYKNDLQESSPLLGLTFLLALWAIKDQKNLLFAVALTIGGLNNETILYLSSVFFFVNVEIKRAASWIPLALKTMIISAPAYMTVLIIRIINYDRPHLGGAWHLADNLHDLYHPILLFNVLWGLAFLRFREKPQFLRRALTTIPLFVIPHLLTGIISETRQMIPLCFIVLPAALLYFRETRIPADCDSRP